MERRLGRGLGSLLSKPTSSEPTQEVELRRIRPNPHQPRRSFDPVALEELRNSIREHGVLQPILLRSQGDGYEIIAGERRWRAARLAGRDAIPAVVRADVSDEQMLELALVENVQRNDLDAMEKARGFRALQTGLGLSQDQVAVRVGLQRATVANHLRLLDLPEAVQEAVQAGLLGMGHARALLALDGAQAQTELAQRIAREELSVRAVERLVRERLQPRTNASPPAQPPPAESQNPPWVRDVARRLQEALGTRVRITSDAQCRGQIVLDFYERADLDRILAALAPADEI
jgi:ParB family chromosome partitioning protein